ncbi:SNF2-related protein [Kineococcus indalonis]|uniref:SNF2-related protein n=1 Tax=Kineococcus indalonis TaxID=2696566 RepID=UPI0014120768|nr:SNF2-related protein [Kineococcus indalonis]NAZ86332.1 helicase [Kineococcus indalonis]
MPHRRQDPQAEDLFSLGEGSAAGTGFILQRLARLSWPDPTRFPLNHAGVRVAKQVSTDLEASGEALMVAGFASIAEVVELLARREQTGKGRLRLLLGSEPFTGQRRTFGSPAAQFAQEVRAYWLEQRGISLHLSAKIIQARRALEEGRLAVRFVSGPVRLHAKIYASEDAVTLGSSNFTANGLRAQIEANVRFSPDEPDYAAAYGIAENYWSQAEEWNEQFAALLDSLLHVVTWQEALARACADLLSGQWAQDHLPDATSRQGLWPSQVAGIAEALWVVENVGSVLIADATGSGKTRMGAHLARTVRDRLLSTGRVRTGLTVLVSPPSVQPSWQREAVRCGLSLHTVSHGTLSRPSDVEVPDEAVNTAQILAVDEAHNFLNPASKRTQSVRDSTAEHKLLFTATPINSGARDLLALVDLLGADNFDDEALKVLDQLERRDRARALMDPQMQRVLRAEIQRFTVRRTKTMLNEGVDAHPEAYIHPDTGRICRYPQHLTHVYRPAATAADEDLASQIRKLAADLRGVCWIGSYLSVPASMRRRTGDEAWLKGRLAAAAGLAAHNVAAAMRSSRAALLEHLAGTAAAQQRFAIDEQVKAQPSGNMAGKAAVLAEQPPPRTNLACSLPQWLSDPDAWRAACRADAALYRQMSDLAGQLSDARDRSKAQAILDCAAQHRLVLAFDHLPITLVVLHRLLRASKHEVFLATGSHQSGKRKVTDAFRPGSDARGIALCSDAMSEGINLQGASALLHLDFPTTMRVAEQRVGRVDRMNSPHDEIESWWPQDSPAFATRSDEVLRSRMDESASLLGANLTLPDASDLRPPLSTPIVDAAEHAQQMHSEAPTWDGIRDAFAPVRDLVAGSTALIPAATYNAYRHVSQRILARVSPVTTRSAWAFFALSSRLGGAPRWMLLAEDDPQATLGLEAVAEALRQRLSEDPDAAAMDEQAQQLLDRLLTRAERAERDLLPRRHRRALEQMASVATAWASAASRAGRYEEADRWTVIKGLAHPVPDDVTDPVDPIEVAERWLRVVRPRLEAIRPTITRRYLRLADIDRDLTNHPLTLDDVEGAFHGLTIVEPFSHRISACILGVPAARGLAHDAAG